MALLTIQDVGLITVTDAATQLGISRQTAHNRIKRENIQLIEISKKTFAILKNDIPKLAGKRKLGRPRKQKSSETVPNNPENS